MANEPPQGKPCGIFKRCIVLEMVVIFPKIHQYLIEVYWKAKPEIRLRYAAAERV
jgi:hypothetical protein